MSFELPITISWDSCWNLNLETTFINWIWFNESTIPTSRPLYDGVKAIHLIAYSNEINFYFNALKTKSNMARGKRILLDQNEILICFIRTVSKLSPFLARVNNLCELALYFGDFDPSRKADPNQSFARCKPIKDQSCLSIKVDEAN